MRDVECKPLGEMFDGIKEEVGPNCELLTNVEVLAFDRLWGHISSPEDFCEEGVGALMPGCLEPGAPTLATLCIAGGRGGTDRTRRHYGLWKAIKSADGLVGQDAWEEEVVEENDFLFAGAARIESDQIVGALAGSTSGSSSFVYLGGDGLAPERWAVVEAFKKRYALGFPHLCGYNLLPVLSSMGKRDAVLCVQNYGDGLCMYLFRLYCPSGSGKS